MSTGISAKINLRKDSLANWTEKNPRLGNGEMALVEDNGLLAVKIGNGISSFTQLPFLYQQEFKTDRLTAKEATVKALSQGYNVSSTPTSLATGVFSEAKGDFGVVHGVEAQVLSTDNYAFVYSGVNQKSTSDRYTSHGTGTFNVNPERGLSGFYIGEKSLHDIVSESFGTFFLIVDRYLQETLSCSSCCSSCCSSSGQDTGAAGYKIVTAHPLCIDDSSLAQTYLCCQVDNRTITTIEISSESTPVVVVLPQKTD
jgi:hypothetical protein